MNKVILAGNITRDPEKRTTTTGKNVTSFTVACQRRAKNADGGYDADFINCVAWGVTADFVAQYFQKGSRIGLCGRLQSRSYDDKNGNKRYVTEVVVDEVEFGGSKASGGSGYPRTENQNPAEPDFGPELNPFRESGEAKGFTAEDDGFKPLEESELPF